jgi:L,D-transpeptidase ErfK/SrfK
MLLCFFCGAGLFQLRATGAEILFREDVGGRVGSHTIRFDESLVELARSSDVGYNEMMAANPGIDPFIPDVGTIVTIPGRWILPDMPKRTGIVINLAEMRLYYFRSGELVETFPVGIGDEGWETPTGVYRIVEKIANPSWHVPESIRKQRPELPKVLPPGKGNPLGSHALRLSSRKILIHGTDHPFGIGRKVSHGCIHLYPEDIRVLFRKVRLDTSVTIVRQQVKATLANGRVLVEAHAEGNKNLEREATALLEGKGLMDRVDPDKLHSALQARSGMPTDVTEE